MLITRRGLRVVQAAAGIGVSAVVLILAAIVSGSPGSAPRDDSWMSMRGDRALRAAPCPSPSSIAIARFSPGRLAAARDGVFDVFGDRPTRLEVPIDWTIDPLQAHRFRQNLHKLRFLEPLLWSYASAGNLDDLQLATTIALDWVRQNRPRKAGVPGDAWTDKVIGDRVPFLAYVLRAAACEDLLSTEDRGALLESVAEHGQTLSSRTRFIPDNHGLFVDLGLLRLTNFVPFLDQVDEWRRLARGRFERTLRGRLSQGVWLEHSSAYQFLAIRAVEQFLAVHGPDAEISELLAGMRQAAAWFVKPDGEMTQFGDSNLEPVPEWATEATSGLAGMRVFFDAGFGFVRATGAAGDLGYLAVSDGFHNHTHKHADELSFELFDHGTSVVSDTGLYDKDPGPARDFVVSSRAHSVLTVDQLDFPISVPGTVHGSGLLAAGEGDGWYAIEGKNPLVKPQGVRHRRLFLYRPGEALVIVDRVRSSTPHTYTRYLQLHPEISLDEGPDSREIAGPNLTGAIHDLETGASVTSSQARGQEEPPQGLTSPEFREFVPRWTIAYADQATSETRVLTIALDETDLHADRVDVAADGVTLTLLDATGASVELEVTRAGRELSVVAG